MAHKLDTQAARSLFSKTDRIYHILSVFKTVTTKIQLSLENMPKEDRANVPKVYTDWMNYYNDGDPLACNRIEHYFVEYFLGQWAMQGIFGTAERSESVKSLEKIALEGLLDAMKTYREGGGASSFLEPMEVEDPHTDIYQKYRPFNGQLIRPEPEEEPPSPASSSGRVSFYSMESDMILGPMEKHKDTQAKSSG